MYKSSLFTKLAVFWFVCYEVRVEAFTVPRSKDFRGTGELAKDAVSTEPSCEELKAMWRFSKRQSRAAEITNEIPTYRDPFFYNVWEPFYARSRSMGGMRVNPYRGGPIYGRVVHKAPSFRIHDMAERNRAFEEVARMYGNMRRMTEPRRRVTAFRLGGGHVGMGLPPQTGSFQHLKELIRTERARELQKQRMAEEAAARQAFKEYGNNNNGRPQGAREIPYLYEPDPPAQDEQVVQHEGVLAFPDLLAPANVDEGHYMPEYYTRDRHSSSLFDTSSFNNDYEGMMF